MTLQLETQMLNLLMLVTATNLYINLINDILYFGTQSFYLELNKLQLTLNLKLAALARLLAP